MHFVLLAILKVLMQFMHYTFSVKGILLLEV